MNSKIKTWEWIALIISTIVIDIVQVILTFFVVGLLINRFVDVAIGFGLPIYFWMRGINMLDTKRLGTAVLVGLLEEVGLGGDDGLPLWTLEVILIWATVKGEEKIAKSSLMGKALSLSKGINAVRSPVNFNGRREPNIQNSQNDQSDQIRNRHIAPPPLNVGGMRMPAK